MVMPAAPIANLIVGEPGLALAALDALFDTMFGFGHTGKLREFRFRSRVGQIVICLQHFILLAVSITDHHQHFLVAFLSLVGARHHASWKKEAAPLSNDL